LADLPNPDEPNDVPNHDYSKYKLRFNGYIGHRTIDPMKPAPTVTARGDDKGGVVVLHHPSNQRRMSCRELATVQSFPIDYAFSGTRSSVYRQIGNAVPPLLACAVAKQFNSYCA
jgi:DNA (cytosine-5)-methyltransferase 1